MTVAYHKLKQVVTPIAVAVSDEILLSEQSNWYAAIDLANVFFSIPVNKLLHKQFTFSWKGQQYIFLALLQDYINISALCHNLVTWDLVHFSLPQNIRLVHYIIDIVLIGLSEQEAATTLDLLVRHLCAKEWEIHLKKLKDLLYQ